MVATCSRSQEKVYKYMQQASRTGILFLVYSKSPTSILYDYSDSMLVLSDSGVVLYYGGSASSLSSPGSISTSRSVLFDPYFDPQPNYNSMDRVYHLVGIASHSHAAHLRRHLPAAPAAVHLPQQRHVGVLSLRHAAPSRFFRRCRSRRWKRLQTTRRPTRAVRILPRATPTRSASRRSARQ